MIQHYIKVALRSLLKHKIQYLITIICLVIGIFCSSIGYYYLNEFINPFKKLPNQSRMIQLSYFHAKEDLEREIFHEDMLQIAEQCKTFGIELIAFSDCMDEKKEIIIIDEHEEIKEYNLPVRYVNEDFFKYYHCTSIHNAPLHLRKGEVLISKSFAEKNFGSKDPTGYKVAFINQVNRSGIVQYFTIAGVTHDIPVAYKYGMTHQINGDLFFHYEDMDPKSKNMYVTGWLTKEKSLQEVNRALKSNPFIHDGKPTTLQAELVNKPARNTFLEIGKWILFSIISLVLIAALIHFLKFCIQTFFNRTHELGLRKCLGSSWIQLFMILFSEIIIILIVVAFLNFCFSELFISQMSAILPDDIYVLYKIKMSALWGIQTKIFLYTLLLCILITLFATIRIRHISTIKSINNGFKNSRHSIRNIMMGIQLFICFLFTGTSIGFYLMSQEMGRSIYRPFSEKECRAIFRLDISLSTHVREKANEIFSELKTLPGVADVTLEGSSGISYKTKKGEEIWGKKVTGAENFFSFYQIPVTGKTPEYNEDRVFISESFARILQNDSIEGLVTLGDKSYQIAGVFPTLPFEAWNLPLSVFISNRQFKDIRIKTLPGKYQKVRKGIEAICRRYIPETSPLEIETLYDYIRLKENKTGSIDLTRNIALILSVVSLLITILGIYSAITLDTMSRQKEVAIRKINGATPGSIAKMFGRLYIILLILACSLASPIVYLYMNMMKGSEISSLDNPWWCIRALILITPIVFITIALKIYNVMKLNPAEVIKNERTV